MPRHFNQEKYFYVNMKLQISAFFLVILAVDTYAHNIGIFTDTDGEDVQQCLASTEVAISSLASLIVNTSNTTITLCQKTTLLSGTLAIHGDVSDITLAGFNSKSVILCQGDQTPNGLAITSVNNVTITNIHFNNCGVLFKGRGIAAVFIAESTDLKMHNVQITNSTGTGVMLYNVGMRVEITRSKFIGSREGSGLHVEMDGVNETECMIYQCKFISNSAKGEMLTRGGGLNIILHNTSDVQIDLDQVNFTNNSASEEGGGLSIVFDSVTSRNEFTAKNAQFVSNTANVGGGIKFSSTKSPDKTNKVTLTNCSLSENRAQFGSAIGIFPYHQNTLQRGYSPEVAFDNLELDSNTVSTKRITNDSLFRQYEEGNGALYCSGYFIQFRGISSISNNNGSAFYMIRCNTEFKIHSMITFSNNAGYYGGAIHLVSSSIIVNSKTAFTFFNNSAFATGGALHFYSEEFSYSRFSKQCFFQKINSTNVKTVHFRFENNRGCTRKKLEGCNNSIHAISFLPCYHYYKKTSIAEVFQEVGQFDFRPSKLEREVTTLLNHSKITKEFNSSILSVIPGKPTTLPIVAKDGFNKTIPYTYSIQIVGKDAFDYSLTGMYSMTLKGKPGENFTIYLITKSSLRIVLLFEVKLQNCPPGFVLLNQSECKCSSSQNLEKKYFGIEGCNLTSFKALAKKGMWVGYQKNMTNYTDLITGYCPIGFCSRNTRDPVYDLPAVADVAKLSDAVCDGNREGILCGKCRKGFSTYYHSPNYKCGWNNLCKIGWLFYILSEILPVTLVFSAIILYDIPLTSGLISGFILYTQVIETILQGSSSSTAISPSIKALSDVHGFFYQMFQLQFFVHDKLSFCIWKGQNALDVLAINYFTSLYAFILLVSIILMLRYCNCRCTSKRKFKKKFIKQHFIHGISAFFVLFYSKTATVSVFLLRKRSLFAIGNQKFANVLYFYGGYTWFSSSHLPYAIPAIMVLAVFVVIPTVLLLVYPLHFKVLARLKISETKFVLALLKFAPLERLKPFFDSFQGTFKDNYRFFAGLYFVYRFAVLLNLALTELWVFYLVGEIQFVAMSILTAICQPHKKRLHNIIDSLLFGNLAIINALTTYINYLSYTIRPKNVHSFYFSEWFQMFLIYLPLVIFVAAIAIKLLNSYKAGQGAKGPAMNDELLEMTDRSPPLSPQSSGFNSSVDYEPQTDYSYMSTT